MGVLSYITVKYRTFGTQDTEKSIWFYLFAGAFMANWSVPPTFSFGFYIKETIGVSIGHCITLDWVPWLWMLVPILLGVIISSSTDTDAMEPEVKIFAFTVYNLIWVLATLAFGVWIRTKCHDLYTYMGAYSTEARARIREVVDKKKQEEGAKLGDVSAAFGQQLGLVAKVILESGGKKPPFLSPNFTNRAIQALSLGTSLQCALYLTHFIHLIDYNGLSVVWHVLCVITFFCGFALIPWILINVAEVNAVFNPDPEVVAHCMADAEAYSKDIKHIYTRLEESVKGGFVTTDMLAEFEVDVARDDRIGHAKELQDFLFRLHVPMRKVDLDRLTERMDIDGAGIVTYAEFFNAVNGDPPKMSEKKGAQQLIQHLQSLK
jgi:hypothetical protein